MAVGFRTYNVLFVSARNTARSILAEALLNRLGAGRFEAWSAGYHPAMITPHVTSLLHKINYNTGKLASKAMTAVTGDNDPGFDFIIRLCADGCGYPAFKGHPVMIDWHLSDCLPAADLFSLLAGRIDVLANFTDATLNGGDITARLWRMGDDYLKLAS